MTNISRRHLFKTATAAGLAVGIPATQKAQAQVSDIRKIPKEFTAGLQSKMVYEPVPAAGIDLNTTGTFEQAASILNEGERHQYIALGHHAYGRSRRPHYSCQTF